MPQSRSRQFTVRLPELCLLDVIGDLFLCLGVRHAVELPGIHLDPVLDIGLLSWLRRSRFFSGFWITTRMGKPYFFANSKSRWSWAGTDMIAPVPYSISTKLPTQTGTFSLFSGLTA